MEAPKPPCADAEMPALHVATTSSSSAAAAASLPPPPLASSLYPPIFGQNPSGTTGILNAIDPAGKQPVSNNTAQNSVLPPADALPSVNPPVSRSSSELIEASTMPNIAEATKTRRRGSVKPNYNDTSTSSPDLSSLKSNVPRKRSAEEPTSAPNSSKAPKKATADPRPSAASKRGARSRRTGSIAAAETPIDGPNTPLTAPSSSSKQASKRRAESDGQELLAEPHNIGHADEKTRRRSGRVNAIAQSLPPTPSVENSSIAQNLPKNGHPLIDKSSGLQSANEFVSELRTSAALSQPGNLPATTSFYPTPEKSDRSQNLSLGKGKTNTQASENARMGADQSITGRASSPNLGPDSNLSTGGFQGRQSSSHEHSAASKATPRNPISFTAVASAEMDASQIPHSVSAFGRVSALDIPSWPPNNCGTSGNRFLSTDEEILNLRLEGTRARQEEMSIKIQLLTMQKERQTIPPPFNPFPVPLQSKANSPKAPTPEALSLIDDTPERMRAGRSKLNSDVKPVHDVAGDNQFKKEVLQMLTKMKYRASKRALKDRHFGDRAALRLQPLIDIAEPPSESEALFLSPKEAADRLKPNVFFPGPIITEGQQLLPLQTPDEFLSEFHDDSVKVWIQDQAVRTEESTTHARLVTIAQVKARFEKPGNAPPWNCLELATHRDDGLRPAFLNSKECSLLTKIKQPGLNDEASRRGFIPGWREVEKWALLAQAGALTEPHQDSHGYNTFITLNHGRAGFGWLSQPTPEQRAGWCANPQEYAEGNWRFVVLKPGQTVYFPTGTVHFVFRLSTEGPTLAFGGHLLRCSQIAPWARSIVEEQMQPNVTNEDLKVAAHTYLSRVETYVKQAKKKRDEERWGGSDACDEFVKLKAKCLKLAAQQASMESGDDDAAHSVEEQHIGK